MARNSRLESGFQDRLVVELEKRFPGCVVVKNDPTYIQGFPDLSIFYGDRWAILECKKSRKEKHQPNQDYYLDTLNRMSFSRFIYPENKEEVLNDLQQTFKSRRSTRVSRRK